MPIQRYREALALPKVGSIILLMCYARLPLTAVTVAVSLHVVTDLHRGYGAAGMAVAALSVGAAIGAPVVGHLLDRFGMRPVVAGCGIVMSSYLLIAAWLPFELLAVFGLVACVFFIPVHSLTRQFLTSLTPEVHRRAVFSIDMTAWECLFIIGPVVAVLAIDRWSAGAVLTGMGVMLGTATLALLLMNPPLHGEVQQQTKKEPSRAAYFSWLNAPIAGSLVIGMGPLFVVMGVELTVVAAMRETGQTAWTGVVLAFASILSVVGGLVLGAVRRSVSQATLTLLYCGLAIPVGMFGKHWWLLALAMTPMAFFFTPAMAAAAEAISNLAPAHARGAVMGLQDATFLIGEASAGPVVGLAIDRGSAALGFMAAGAGGVAFLVGGLLLTLAVRAVSGRETQPALPDVSR